MKTNLAIKRKIQENNLPFEVKRETEFREASETEESFQDSGEAFAEQQKGAAEKDGVTKGRSGKREREREKLQKMNEMLRLR